MKDSATQISFHVIPRPNGIAEAEARLRNVGFKQIKRSHDEQRLHIVAPRDLVERVFGCSLMEKKRRGRLGALERKVADLDLPEGIGVPPSLKDVIAETIFPVTPDYHSNLGRF